MVVHMIEELPTVGIDVLVSHTSIHMAPIMVNEMSDVEIDAYNKGYDDNEASGGHKEW